MHYLCPATARYLIKIYCEALGSIRRPLGRFNLFKDTPLLAGWQFIYDKENSPAFTSIQFILTHIMYQASK
jgi:hypothetical protein